MARGLWLVGCGCPGCGLRAAHTKLRLGYTEFWRADPRVYPTRLVMTSDDRLAIDGAEPTVRGGPFDWPQPDDAIREALDAAYRNGSWGKYDGPNCEQLRHALSTLHGTDHVQLTSSGTVAVELAHADVREDLGRHVHVGARRAVLVDLVHRVVE